MPFVTRVLSLLEVQKMITYHNAWQHVLFCAPTGNSAVNDGLCLSTLEAVKLNSILTRIGLIWTGFLQPLRKTGSASGLNGFPTFVAPKEISILTLLYIKLKLIYSIFIKKIWSVPSSLIYGSECPFLDKL
jgi:hypothetical protein